MRKVFFAAVAAVLSAVSAPGNADPSADPPLCERETGWGINVYTCRGLNREQKCRRHIYNPATLEVRDSLDRRLIFTLHKDNMSHPLVKWWLKNCKEVREEQHEEWCSIAGASMREMLNSANKDSSELLRQFAASPQSAKYKKAGGFTIHHEEGEVKDCVTGKVIFRLKK